jgi:phospholipid transport system substrate-binding protein
MLTRRSLLTLTGGAMLTLALGVPAFAQSAAAQRAEAFVRASGNELVGIVNGPGSMAEKRRRLQEIIDRTVDVDGIARFCLGRYWRTATSEQQQQYVTLFHEVLLNSITGKLGEYKGVELVVNRGQTRDDTQHVDSVVQRPNNPPTNVDWVVSEAGGSPKIIDVIAEGTSLRQTTRSDYAAYLARNNNSVPALIQALRQQVSQNG